MDKNNSFITVTFCGVFTTYTMYLHKQYDNDAYYCQCSRTCNAP